MVTLGAVAAGERSAAAKIIEDACGTCSEEFDDSSQRNPVVAVKFRDSQSERRLKIGDAERWRVHFGQLF
jgi:hypothetical protein